uniref:Uncharacterized protein n=1 Tax=Anguilla anguilla TaxID=7936 RepID=A0A0E9THG6_ANGAN
MWAFSSTHTLIDSY